MKEIKKITGRNNAKKLRNLTELLYKMQMEALYKENQMMDRLSSIKNK
jgi:hypothetical protein